MFKVQNIKHKFLPKKAFFSLTFFVITFISNAQCAMCRAALESEEGGQKAKAVNDGIVYLMAFPYLLVGILGYIIYKSRTKKKV
jgi:Na+/H+ antiporter NhaC